MKCQTTLNVSCGKVLKAKAQTMIFTQVQSDDEDDRESVSPSKYFSNDVEEDIAQTYHITLIEDGEVEEEEAEDAPVELEGRGIEIEQAKIDTILRMPEPRNIHELKSLQGKLAYLQRFISNLASRCQPFSRLMKKDVPFQWDEACDKERSVGILLAQKNNERKENTLYYLSRTMMPNELKYTPNEKLYLTLIFSIQKLKHYFQSYSIHLVSKPNPLKYVMASSIATI
ncbi:UNVERIFIED_CONTAM: hypothetical protein Scaly_2755000 [Sesamum calycinum]|uniref:Reverse transcriptase RNase H-like domain-containing protein n=1 Tax=Sesamum calycinum TaxID=2727403 RepID=A0AAW2J0A0_9LAMI